MTRVRPYAVVGATSWGVTLAWLLSLNHGRVLLIVRDQGEADRVRAAGGVARLPEVRLPARVDILPEVPAPGDLAGIVFAVPAQSMRAAVERLQPHGSPPLLSAAKGLELSSGLRMSEVLGRGQPAGRIAALSGPNLAHEIARGLPAAAVVASTSDETARMWQRALSTPFFRLYTSRDVVGVELAGALKNVVAIAAGAASALDLGANAMAAIVTRGLAEITRLGVALGADPLTFQGLAGVGDLAATCFSPLSRNHRLGELLASGYPPERALAEIGEAVEGAPTSRVALRLAAAAGVELPIAAQVAAVLAGECDARGAMAELLTRPLKPESPSVGE